jgi:hypothetical protein
MGRTELVIFDCDGVLIDSEVISARMLIAELAGYGVDMDMAFVSRHFLGRSYPVVLKEVRERWGIALPERFEADYRARLLAAFERDLTVMPGAVQAIAALDPLVDETLVVHARGETLDGQAERLAVHVRGIGGGAVQAGQAVVAERGERTEPPQRAQGLAQVGGGGVVVGDGHRAHLVRVIDADASSVQRGNNAIQGDD